MLTKEIVPSQPSPEKPNYLIPPYHIQPYGDRYANAKVIRDNTEGTFYGLAGIGDFFDAVLSPVKKVGRIFKKTLSDVTHTLFPDKVANILDKAVPIAAIFLYNPYAATAAGAAYYAGKGSYSLIRSKIRKELKKQLPPKIWKAGIENMQKKTAGKLADELNKISSPIKAEIIAVGTSIGAAIGGSVTPPPLPGAVGASIGGGVGALAADLIFANVMKKIALNLVKGATQSYASFVRDCEQIIDSKDFQNATDYQYCRTLADATREVKRIDVAKLGLKESYFTNHSQNVKLAGQVGAYLIRAKEQGIIPQKQVESFYKKFWDYFVKKPDLAKIKAGRLTLLSICQSALTMVNQAIENNQKLLDDTAKAQKGKFTASLQVVKDLSALGASKFKIKKVEVKVVEKGKPTMKVQTQAVMVPTTLAVQAQQEFVLPSPEITATTPPADLTFSKVVSWYDDQLLSLNTAKAQTKDPEITALIDANITKVKSILKGACEEILRRYPQLQPKIAELYKSEGIGIVPLIIAGIIAVAGSAAVTSYSLSDYLETGAETEKIEAMIEAREAGVEIYQPSAWADPKIIIPVSLVALAGIGTVIYFVKAKGKKK